MAGWVTSALLKLLFAAFAIAVPVLGVWIASSLAAYENGPIWAVLLAGLLAFPILPIAWDGINTWRRARKGPIKRILTFFDRLILRTLALNLIFLGGLLAARPDAAFTALSARGDWMLDHVQGPMVRARPYLHAAADRLEWLYLLATFNPYEGMIDEDSTGNDVEVTPNEVDWWIPVDTFVDTPPDDPKAWPFADHPHPLVHSIPAEVETSLENVARYIAAQEPDQVLRVKALHDYVADRIAYDVVSYRSGTYPSQDARTTFERRLSVCAGYANLLAAMGDAAGEEIVVVPGDARTDTAGLDGEGHAWNAAKIGGRWYLMDATWNAGYVKDAFVKEYEASYFMAPPDVFINTHLPDDPKWQLLEQPLSRGDFNRRPMLKPRFFAHYLSLVSPERSQTTVASSFTIQVRNPYGAKLSASARPLGTDGDRSRCQVESGKDTVIQCSFGQPGRYEVLLFSAPKGATTLTWVGELEVNATR